MGCAIFGDENLEGKNQKGIGVLLPQNSPTQRAATVLNVKAVVVFLFGWRDE